MLRNSIQVKFAKSNRRPVSLSYREQSLLHTQARLAGRYALVPDIDLSAFHRKAVIDWVKIDFRLNHRTQGIHVRSAVIKGTGANCLATLVPDDDRDKQENTGRTFTVLLQEPTIPQMLETEQALENRYGLDRPASIRAIEISIDWRPKIALPDARTRMLAVLQRHHLPTGDFISSGRDRPRFSWGPGPDFTSGVLPIGPNGGTDDHVRLVTDHDRQPFGDATYYVGREHGPVMWRTMDKEIDQQNLKANTSRVLNEDEKRTRIEVTLRTEEIRRLGIASIDDLRRFRFEKLQNAYFSFTTPTFRRGHNGMMGMIMDRLEEDRRRKFLKTGMIGLREMDAAIKRRRAQHRPRLIEFLHERGRKVKPEDRSGRGPFQTYVAYDELNKAVEAALRNLRERGERELKRVEV